MQTARLRDGRTAAHGRDPAVPARRRSRLAAALAAAVAVTGAAVLTPVGEASASTETATLPSDNPANFTPNVQNGQVDSIWQIGTRVVIGGTFTSISNATQNGGATFTRNRIAAFDATTGLVDTGFAPSVNNEVNAVIPSADPASIYIAGAFTSVNGVTRSRVARVNLSNGQIVAAFNAGSINGQIRDVRLVDNVLYVAGNFTTISGVSRERIAALDATTGAVLSRLNLAFTGTHNGGGTNIMKIEVTPAGDRLLAIGNFTTVAGQTRRQIAMIDIAANPATVAAWSTTFYMGTCASVFNTYMRDLDISADGRFAVISTTGAYRSPPSPCDTISRFEIDTDTANLAPTWSAYTGGDTTYAVEIHDGVVYAGGHMRWLNNPFGADAPGAGAIPREGIVALDVVNGLPFSWNPGRDRGVGVFDFHVTEAGLWAGSDTLRWAGELRQRLAFFPWAGGIEVPADVVGALPNDVYALGRLGGALDPSVLYRVNAGGGLLASVDDGPDWAADTGAFRNIGSNAATWGPVPNVDGTVPASDTDRAPHAVFDSERWDPAGGAEMAWAFPVPVGAPVEVRLYLANRCTCTQSPGQRIFDIDIDGVERIADLDLSATHGHDVGTMRAFDITSDGTIDILFRHQVENPLINAIEIVRTDVAPPSDDSALDDAQRRFFNGSDAPGATTVVPSTVAWRNARGAFMVGGTLFTVHLDGTLRERTFDGATFGPDSTVELYGNTVISDSPAMTGLAYDPVDGRIYYTLAGQNQLYWRAFTPESAAIGAQRFQAGGAIGALSPARVRGMFLSGDQLYFADANSGDLFRIGLSGGVVSGSPVLADDTVDWRARALFVWNGTPAGGGGGGNAPPVASFTVSCVGLTCDVDAGGSGDPDGSIVSYAWDFGEGPGASGVTAQHTYSSGGQFTIELTVTDDDGAVDTDSQQVNVAAGNAPPVASFTVSCVGLTCDVDAGGSGDPDGSIVSYAWSFGEGPGASGVMAQHTYSSGGQFTIELTVTDDDGAVDTDSQQVNVSPPVAGDVAFRASASSNANTSNPSVVVPAAVQAGDQLVLVITHNRSTAFTPPDGFTQIGQASDGSPDMFSFVFTATAGPTTAGSTVTAPTALVTKTSMMLLAYSGAAPVSEIASAVAGPNVAAHTTPQVPIGVAGSLVVNYWSDKTGGNTGWTLPPEVTLREQSLGSGGGQIGAAGGDSAPQTAGTWPGAAATSSTTSGKAIMWSIVIAPA